MKKPPIGDQERCMALRCRSKRGELLSEEDYDFCARMCSQHPEWYGDTEIDVFNRTVPFGSNVQLKKRKKAGERP